MAKQASLNNVRTWVEIDRAALEHNLRQARKATRKNVRLMVVVKSNAYGHGLFGAARIADENSADYLGVDSIDEGIELRVQGIKTPIVVLGYTPKPRLSDCSTFNVEQVVYDTETLAAFAKAARRLRRKARIHLKIETGTSRQGMLPEDIPYVIDLLKIYPELTLEGAYTHFADTENPDSTYYKKQLKLFGEAIHLLKEAGFNNVLIHAAASAAMWLYPETHFDMVRLGISYYGLWPSEAVERMAGKHGITLRPALTWKTRVAQVKRLRKGTYVGYDRTERVKRDSVAIVLPVGYWDGYDRKLSGKGEVLIGGKRCRVMGRVCMNMIMADASHTPGLVVGDTVTLLGRDGREEVTADELAEKIGTINYEVVARINPTLPRIVL